MKRTLLLIPIILVACNSNIANEPKEDRYQNVIYSFNFENRNYKVIANEKTYNISVENTYHIYSNEYYFTTSGNVILENEFYIKGLTQKLYLYHKI